MLVVAARASCSFMSLVAVSSRRSAPSDSHRLVVERLHDLQAVAAFSVIIETFSARNERGFFYIHKIVLVLYMRFALLLLLSVLLTW